MRASSPSASTRERFTRSIAAVLRAHDGEGTWCYGRRLLHPVRPVVCLLVLTLACAGVRGAFAAPSEEDDDLYGEEEAEPAGFPDPFEGFNRMVFDANQSVDPWVVKPVVHTYDAIVPDAVQRAVVRILT